jgi:hypothetical protein
MKNFIKTMCLAGGLLLSQPFLEASCKWRTLPCSPRQKALKVQEAQAAIERAREADLQATLQSAKNETKAVVDEVHKAITDSKEVARSAATETRKSVSEVKEAASSFILESQRASEKALVESQKASERMLNEAKKIMSDAAAESKKALAQAKEAARLEVAEAHKRSEQVLREAKKVASDAVAQAQEVAQSAAAETKKYLTINPVDTQIKKIVADEKEVKQESTQSVPIVDKKDELLEKKAEQKSSEVVVVPEKEEVEPIPEPVELEAEIIMGAPEKPLDQK